MKKEKKYHIAFTMVKSNIPKKKSLQFLVIFHIANDEANLDTINIATDNQNK